MPRKLPLELRAAAAKELAKMKGLEIIERVEEHRDWCVGMVMTPKASGEFRICVDLTMLNKIVKKESFPLPRAEETLASLENSKSFSKMDANLAIW